MGPAGLDVRKDIASPARWNVRALHDLAHQYGESRVRHEGGLPDLCNFKWAFRQAGPCDRDTRIQIDLRRGKAGKPGTDLSNKAGRDETVR